MLLIGRIASYCIDIHVCVCYLVTFVTKNDANILLNNHMFYMLNILKNI